jgi:hypothetical protein
MIALVVVSIHKGFDLGFKIAWQEVVFEQDAVFLRFDVRVIPPFMGLFETGTTRPFCSGGNVGNVCLENRAVEDNDSQISTGAWIAKVEPKVCAIVAVAGESLRPHRAHDKPVSCTQKMQFSKLKYVLF